MNYLDLAYEHFLDLLEIRSDYISYSDKDFLKTMLEDVIEGVLTVEEARWIWVEKGRQGQEEELFNRTGYDGNEY